MKILHISLLAFIFITLTMYVDVSYGQEPLCPASDFACLQFQYETACHDAEMETRSSCLNWLRELEARPNAEHSNVRLIAGATNLALAESSEAPQDAEEFRDRARNIFRDLVVQDPGNVQALVGLSAMADTPEARMNILREIVAIDPTYVRGLEWLASAISASGEPADLVESAEYMKQAYVRQTGMKKWHFADEVVSRFRRAGSDLEANQFTERVRQDISIDPMMMELTNVSSLGQKRVDEILQIICFDPIIAMFGPKICLDGIKMVVQAVGETSDAGSELWLAESASAAMAIIAESGWRLSPEIPNWRNTFIMWLEGLLDSGMVSAPIYVAYARITINKEERLVAMQNAVRLAPSDREIIFGLGMAYFDLEKWNEAIQELGRARSLLPESRHNLIDNIIKLATEALAN